jgi:hypothetical protein
MAAKKKKNTKTDNGIGGKKAASKKNLPSQKKTPKKQLSKKVSKKAVKKKLPTKKTSKQKKIDLKTGAGFASNNFNYIRALIWREFQFDFAGYFDPEFIRIVKEVYNECKAVGRECTDADIFEIYDEVTDNPKRPYPYIGEDLFQSTRQYYEILDVEFSLFPAYLWITSPMIIPPPSEFIVTQYYNKDGNTDKGYKKYFREFVDWANNATRAKNNGNVGSEDVEIFIKFTQPEYNEAERRWESEIFICTEEGIRFSFGFVPKGKGFDHDAGDEYVEPSEELLEEERGKIEPVIEEEAKPAEPTLTTEQIEKRQKASADLFSALIKLTTKYEQLEKKTSKEKDKKQKAKDTSKKKDNELKRLQKIKKEIQSTIRLYKNIKDKRRLNKALKDLDAVMNKIKKLS